MSWMSGSMDGESIGPQGAVTITSQVLHLYPLSRRWIYVLSLKNIVCSINYIFTIAIVWPDDVICEDGRIKLIRFQFDAE